MATETELRIAELQKRRDDKIAALKAQRDEQLVRDLEVLSELEDAHGFHAIVRIGIDEARFVPGLPTMAIYRMPTPAECKRYKDRLKPRGPDKPVDSIGAADELLGACRLYPDAKTCGELFEKFPLMHTHAAMNAIRAAEGQKAEEGKG